MRWPFSKPRNAEDFSNFLGNATTTRKQRLIAECEKYSVTIFIDDSSESSAGVYAQMRAVASEAELERRLLVRKAISKSGWANFIANLALIISIATLVKSIWWP